VDVLLRFDPSSAAKASLPAEGDFPLVWTKTYGQGRVVYSSLSHSSEAWDIRNLQIMMFEAIRWSLGLGEAPVQPHPSAIRCRRPRGKRGEVESRDVIHDARVKVEEDGRSKTGPE